MAFNFPPSPVAEEVSEQYGVAYVWSGVAWERMPTVAAHAASHATGGADAITPASIGAAATSHTHTASQVTDFATESAKYGPVTSVAGRTGTVTLSSSDVSGLGTLATASSVAYSSLTGTPSTFAPSSHASSHAAAGGDPLSVSSSQVSGLAAVATSGSAADLAGTLADARLSSNVPLLPSLLLRTSNENPTLHIDTVPRAALGFSGVTLPSGAIAFAFFTPAVNLTISQIAMATAATAASGLTLARMGIFTFDETTATLVARTASDTALFAATRTIYTRSLSTAGGFPATYTLQAGTRYGVGVICVGTTMPAIAGITPPFELCALTPRVSASRVSQSDLTTVASLGTLSGAPYARLS